MIQPNLRVSILRRATTQFEQGRMSEAHADNDLRLKRIPEQTLVIANAMGYKILSQRTSGSLP